MNDRLPYLDRIKTFLTVLVVLHHTAITYGGEGSWYYTEHADSLAAQAVLTLFTAVNQSFFMGLFFFISGCVTPASYDRSDGAGRFMAKRLVRFGVPLAVYMIVIDPVLWYVSTGYDGSVADYLRERVFPDPLRGVTEFEPGPLWFLVALLLFNAAYAFYRRVTAGRASVRPFALTSARVFGYLAAVSAANFIVRLFLPVGEEVLSLQLGYFPAYVGLFFGGIAASRGQWLERLTTKAARRWGAAAIALVVLLPVVMALGGALDGNTDAFMGGWTWQSAVYSTVDPIMGLGISYVLLVRFRDRRNGPMSRMGRALSGSAFLVFVLHAPIVTYVSYGLRDLALHPLVKFALVGGLATTLCFAIAMAVRRSRARASRTVRRAA
ncbi:acyltransferase family protein [Paenibacillus flagellatus]|uniref:Acyltransferase 3 domain-containing protein n=1 Tax=Paenibacillus flagellatus TaxID=2211139 RepID=A0A2V5KE14_9BACL|nr:acyltransferase [Paenibacillus flagellatus]PYI56534.1 hypothetical protein DLM86_06075 [Paenibacillus flagellatus]